MATFKASYRSKSPCKVCNKFVEKGEMLVWSRRNRGVFYHQACFDQYNPVETVTESGEVTIVSGPAPDITKVPSKLSDVIKTKPVHIPTAAPVNGDLPKLTRISDWWDILAHALQHLNRVVLIGPPGTGKSTTAVNSCGIKHRITMTESTSREDLVGMFHLINGETKWIDGPVVQAMRVGAPVLIDEIDRYSQEVASMLYSILDDAPHVALPTGEIVYAQSGYKVVMTSNEQPDMLPAAIFDRIEGIFVADVPHQDAISHLDKVNQQVVRNYYSGLPKVSVKTTPTVRRMRAFHTLKTNGMEEHAAEIVFAGSAREIQSAMANVKSNLES